MQSKNSYSFEKILEAVILIKSTFEKLQLLVQRLRAFQKHLFTSSTYGTSSVGTDGSNQSEWDQRDLYCKYEINFKCYLD